MLIQWILLVVSIVVAASAVPADVTDVVRTPSGFQERSSDGGYKFAYETESQYRTEARSADGTVTGESVYVGQDGVPVRLAYVADGGGFHPTFGRLDDTMSDGDFNAGVITKPGNSNDGSEHRSVNLHQVNDGDTVVKKDRPLGSSVNTVVTMDSSDGKTQRSAAFFYPWNVIPNSLYYPSLSSIPGAWPNRYGLYPNIAAPSHIFRPPVQKQDNEEEEDEDEGDEGEVIFIPPPGASVAQAKPVGIAIAGEGGVAASRPVGTAVVGPGGLAISQPEAVAIAGVNPEAFLEQPERGGYNPHAVYTRFGGYHAPPHNVIYNQQPLILYPILRY